MVLDSLLKALDKKEIPIKSKFFNEVELTLEFPSVIQYAPKYLCKLVKEYYEKEGFIFNEENSDFPNSFLMNKKDKELAISSTYMEGVYNCLTVSV